jgi:hypothetical protein
LEQFRTTESLAWASVINSYSLTCTLRSCQGDGIPKQQR